MADSRRDAVAESLNPDLPHETQVGVELGRAKVAAVWAEEENVSLRAQLADGERENASLKAEVKRAQGEGVVEEPLYAYAVRTDPDDWASFSTNRGAAVEFAAKVGGEVVRLKDPRDVAKDLWRRIDTLTAANASLKAEVKRLEERCANAEEAEFKAIQDRDGYRDALESTPFPQASDAEQRLRLVSDVVAMLAGGK